MYGEKPKTSRSKCHNVIKPMEAVTGLSGSNPQQASLR